MSGVITFEHQSDASNQVAVVKCALRTESTLSRLIKRQLRLWNAIWGTIFGLVFCVVFLLIIDSAVRAFVAGCIYAVLFYAVSYIPYFARSNRRKYERQILKKTERLSKENAMFLARWRYTIDAEAVEYENLDTGSVVVTKMRSIERAELVGGHLCLFTQGEVTGSIPLEGLASDAERDELRQILNEAGVQGWPRGESVLLRDRRD